MTTPATMNALLEHLRERYQDANSDAAESHKVAMNSYGAGYDRGFADAIKEILIGITGDEP